MIPPQKIANALRLHGRRSNEKGTHIRRMGGGYAFSFLRFWRMGGHEQNCEVRPHFDKTGDSKGVPFGTQPLEQRCSVLYLLARLAGKMRVSHDGHTRFIRQESGQVLRIGMSKKPVRFWKWQQVYCVLAFLHKPKILLKKLHQLFYHALLLRRPAATAEA